MNGFKINKNPATAVFVFSWLFVLLFLLLFLNSRMQNIRLKQYAGSIEQKLKATNSQLNEYRQGSNVRERLEQNSLDYLEWQFVLKEQVNGARQRLSTQISRINDLKKNKELTSLLYYTLGLSNTLATDFNAAIRSFEEAVKFEPKDAESYYNLGLLSSVSRKGGHKAAGYYKKYLGLVPNGPKSKEVQGRIKTLETSS
ncbi:MAG: tetratricopeptide repeat protein [Candidatus Omnitrophica bacterium]|nr:tetratricopeptide repeat protein [Candidatus Omnitrophota bacterium]